MRLTVADYALLALYAVAAICMIVAGAFSIRSQNWSALIIDLLAAVIWTINLGVRITIILGRDE